MFEREEGGRAGGLLLGLAVGALLGAAVALVYAPERGEVTRRKLKRRLRSAGESAREALGEAADRPRLIAVTVLTSLGEADLRQVGVDAAPEAQVGRLAALTAEAGLDGVVCSAREAAMLRRERGRDFLLVTPGIRPADSGSDDQQRIMTPAQALRAGADYLVVGRPITRAADPVAALKKIHAEIADFLGEPT